MKLSSIFYALQLFAVFTLTSTTSFAQSFTITLEPSSLFTENGDTLNHTNQDSLGINIFYAEVDSSVISLSDLIEDPLSPDASGFSSLSSLTWAEMSETSEGSFEFWTTPGWTGASGESIDGTGDYYVLVFLTTSDDISSIEAGDFAGLLVSDSAIAGLGQSNFSLGSATNMSALAGAEAEGTLQMVLVVPEPSAYAALAGLLSLSWVMVRRRRA